jgi:thioredoxin-related protein
MHYDASIIMDVKKIQQLFRRPICEYCNGCKKSTTI